MLRNIRTDTKQISVPVSQAEFPEPFPIGLEYSAPARGHWTIAHVALSLPEAHIIYVCPQGCLRGVVLTAAELNVSQRFSTIEVGEENVLEGDMEDQVIDGVGHILEELPYTPPAVLVFTSCIHQFLGIDLNMIYSTLRQQHPGIQFTDCYMNPIMRKGNWNPDQKMRRQLFTLLKPAPLDQHSVNIVGNDFPLDRTSDLYRLLNDNHYTVREVATSRNYAEYQKMATSAVAITTRYPAEAAGKLLQTKYGQKYLHLPFSYDYAEIIANLQKLSAELGITYQPDPNAITATDQALAAAQQVIGDTPIAIDYTFSTKALGLARLLLDRGFNVTDVYVDEFDKEDQADLAALKASAPNLTLHPTIDVGMRIAPRQSSEKLLALGQKAAYFNGSPYFVNIVEGAGWYGFDGIQRMAKLMIEAYNEPKDIESVIQVKGLGWGCGCI
ncbi:nitrogenase component 1 [Loigolactobacillus binensis]|uniref:Nitrogenase component 1 n=1 Tax=Loigolactobacillus binensis TaxID=2559922 RepID=A0ABW3EAG2_9LACO|nr:nitrogenase component 1 [Loigolactobacillus binensis]